MPGSIADSNGVSVANSPFPTTLKLSGTFVNPWEFTTTTSHSISLQVVGSLPSVILKSSES